MDDRAPRVSVVMPVYNDERHLRESIDSILAQTFTDFEFIIVDDGSSDGGRGVIEDYTDPRIRLLHQDNAGIVIALNRGIEAARGEFIARQDSDDASLPGRLERQVGFLAAHPGVAMVGSWFERFDERSQPIAVTYTMDHDIDIRRELFLRSPFGHGTVMIRSSVLRAAGGYRNDYPHNEDVDLWRRVMAGHAVANLPEVLYRWRENPHGITGTRGAAQTGQTARLLDRIWAETPLPDYGLRETREAAAHARAVSPPHEAGPYHQYFWDQYHLAGQIIRRGSPMRGLRLLLIAWLADPGMLVTLVRRRLRSRSARARERRAVGADARRTPPSR